MVLAVDVVPLKPGTVCLDEALGSMILLCWLGPGAFGQRERASDDLCEEKLDRWFATPQEAVLRLLGAWYQVR